MLTFATLGPSGSNHERVTRAYLELHGFSDARIVFVDDFDQALELMVAGTVQHAVQAGRLAYLSGRIPKRLYATASSPEDGVITSKPR